MDSKLQQEREVNGGTPFAEARGSAAMSMNIPGDKCEICGAVEVDAITPRTVYACGSSDYDKRPGTHRRGNNCKPPNDQAQALRQQPKP
jgi:hypothetical protein